MYYNNKINQASRKEKSLLIPSFSHKDSQIDHYLASCTPSQQTIASILMKYRNAPWIRRSNIRIASLVGCTVRTVIRATNKFHKDGFITKHQVNKYATNYYTLNDKIKRGKYAFSHWINSLSSKNQELYISHGIRVDHKNKIIYSYENVTQNKNSLILDSLFSKCMYVSSRTCEKKTTYTRKPINKKRRMLVNEIQKQLILDNRHDPRIKDILSNPKIRAEIITPIIEKISMVLTLDEKEQFKLIAFTKETLEHVYKEIEYAIANKKVPHVPNRMEWIILFATKYCADNNLKPDWKWYYNLCEIIGVDSRTPQKPFNIQRPRQVNVIKQRQVLSFDERRNILLKEIEGCRIKLADPDKHFRFLIEESIRYVEKELECKLLELSELDRESSNEKQVILYQNSSNSMAQGCA